MEEVVESEGEEEVQEESEVGVTIVLFVPFRSRNLGSLTFLVGLFSMQKRKGTEGIIEVENPNLAKMKNVRAKDVDVSLIL